MSSNIDAICRAACGRCEDCLPYARAIEMHIRSELRRGGWYFSSSERPDNLSHRINYAHYRMETVVGAGPYFESILRGRGLDAWWHEHMLVLEWCGADRVRHQIFCERLSIIPGKQSPANEPCLRLMHMVLTSPHGTSKESIAAMLRGGNSV